MKKVIMPKKIKGKERNQEIIRFRTKREPGDPSAVIGFAAAIPLDIPIIFTKINGRYGWKLYDQTKPK